MSESTFAGQVKEGVYSTDIPVDISYIESPDSSPGIPDTNIAVGDVERFVELKYEGRIGKVPKVRPSQVRWFKKRVRVGAKPFLFAKLTAKHGFIYLLIPGENVAELPGLKTIEEWEKLSSLIWRARVNWYDFLCRIRGDYDEE